MLTQTERDRLANELVLLSCNLQNVQAIAAQLQPWQHALIIDNQSSVAEQVLKHLEAVETTGQAPVTAIHMVAHGSDGMVMINPPNLSRALV